ncbi:glycerol dehydrogenase [Enterococcus sp. HY326]|uniref:glycerol dehydrogenase n=1 Tax=Enterococcus sp. HY326 TaxID=2971265 RepID=UPI00223FF48D|nr:glycerol dehydrogenase [Enterococcus sp. HY326]
MEKIFISPARYVQGKGVLKSGISHIKKIGTKSLLLCDDFVWQLCGEAFAENLKTEGLTVLHLPFNGESSEKTIQAILAKAKGADVDVVLGLGGGKTIDSAKGIADCLSLPVVILPTTASTDAPTSAISVMYSEDGVFEKYQYYQKSPQLVLVDTEIIVQGPVRLLASGIADALATWVEVRAVLQSRGKNLLGGGVTLAAQAIAEKCQAVLFEFGKQALAANQAKVVTEAFEQVVEANTLLSGIGFESGGLAAAHAIHNGFSKLTGEIQQLTHGEKVAYGTLTQLFLENRPKAELDRFIDFYQDLNLPTTLAELHLETNYSQLLEVGQQATISQETMSRMPFKIEATDVADCLLAVDSYVKSLKNEGK